MKNRISIAFLVLIFLFACGGGSSSGRPKTPRRGWLCDFDGTGSIRLWTAASMDATVKDVVGTCVGCCVDVTMYDETSKNGILFYRISVGSQSGWVDVEYFYWEKPNWSTN